MVSRRYLLPGLTLRVADHGDDVGRFALSPLSAFETSHGGAFAHDIVIRAAPGDDIPTRGIPVWSGKLIDGTYAEISRDGAVFQLRIPGRVSMLDDPALPVTLVDAVDAVAEPIAGMATMLLIDMALRWHGLLTVHAATLLVRDGEGVVLLFAPSGFGKTTTSLVLALGGYGLMGDDVTVFRKTGKAFLAWGLPRTLKVHRNTAALLPQLGPHLGPYDHEDEARLTVAALASMTAVPDVVEHAIRAVIVVGKRSEGPATLTRVSKQDALSAILSDNVGVLDDGVPAHGQILFAALSQLIATTPAYRLDAGADSTMIVPAFDAAFPRTDSAD